MVLAGFQRAPIACYGFTGRSINSPTYFPVPAASARLRSAALVCKRLNSQVTILSGFSRSRLVGAPALDRMRNGMASTRGAARSSDASRTGTFKFGFGSLAACFADARPRAATRVRKLLGSRPTILAGLSGPRLVPVTCGFADGA